MGVCGCYGSAPAQSPLILWLARQGLIGLRAVCACFWTIITICGDVSQALIQTFASHRTE